MTKRQKLKQVRRPEETPMEEMIPAFDTLGKWLTKKLKGRTDSGPFSEANLGEPAIICIPKRVYTTWQAGNWKWKESLSLTTQLIRIARSEMSHIVRDWKAQGEPEVIAASQDETVMQSLREMEAEEQVDEELKALAYEIAEQRLKDDQRLLKFLHLVRELNDRRAISKRLKITIVEVREIETEMLEKVKLSK